MATGDGGLQNTTLQDGYEKLLISDAVGGIGDVMTHVSTSQGVSMHGSPLYMGQANDRPMLKLIAQGYYGAFFSIQEAAGTTLQNIERPLLVCYAGSSSQGNSVSQFSQIVSLSAVAAANTNQTNMSSGQIVFGTLAADPNMDANSLTMGGPTIFTNTSTGYVHFRIEGNDPSKKWSFDRLEVNNGGIATTIPVFDASAASVVLGDPTHEVTIGGQVESSGGFVAYGDNALLSSTTDTIVTATNSIQLQNAKTINIMARDDVGDAAIYIDALNKNGENKAPSINIGTKNQAVMQLDTAWDTSTNAMDGTSETFDGTLAINIGTRETSNDAELTQLNLGNAYVIHGGKVLTKHNQWTAADAATTAIGGPLNASSWTADECGIYWIDDVSAELGEHDVRMYWYDGKTDTKRELVSHEYSTGAVIKSGTARTTALPDFTIGESRKYLYKDTNNYIYDVIDYQVDGSHIYKHMRIDDTTDVYTSATALPNLP